MPQALVTLPDGRKAKVTFDTPDQLDAVVSEMSGPSRDPNEIDPNTGKTRAQLEQELAANQAESERLGADLTGKQNLAELARAAFMPFVKMTQGMQSLPALAADAVLPGQPFQQSAEQNFGNRSYFAPRDGTERFAGKVYEGLGGAMTGAQGGAVLANTGARTAQAAGANINPSMLATRADSAASGVGSQLQNLKGILAATTGSVAGSETARELGANPFVQTLAGMAGSMAPGVTSNLVQRGVKRLVPDASPEAKALMAKGVNLTAGQQRPGKAVSQLEDALQDWPIVGPAIKQSKEAAQAQAREAFILEGAAPGAKVKPTGDLQKTLSEVGDTFTKAYDKVGGFPLVLQKGKPVIVKTGANEPLHASIAKVVSDKGIDATAASRKEAASWLGNLLTRPIKNSEDLLSMRSTLRSRIKDMATDSTESAAKREIYQGAEKRITEALESQLPPKLMRELKAVDAQYSKYKTAVDAMASAKDRPEGFTFAQASQAAAKSATKALGKDAYAKGAGNMREIPAAAQAVFKQSPPTGARMMANLAGAPLLPVVAFGALTKAGRNVRTMQPGPYSPPPAAFSSFLAQRPWEQR